jgi:hypothetical protein
MQLLYKYTCFSEYTEELVAEPRLWFSQPIKLNDPFECRPWLDFNYERQQLVEAMARHLRRVNPGMTTDTATAIAVGIFLEGRHQRPEMWDSLRKEIVTRITQEIGVLCLSATGENILMWSHYGKHHTGICLGFEWSAYTPFFGRAQEVQYSDSLPTVDVFNTPSEQQVDQIFLTKFTDWNYEKEWRIIEHEAGPGSHEYPSELLRTITFGLNASAFDREQVRTWASRRDHPVVFQECVLDEREFKLRVREAA